MPKIDDLVIKKPSKQFQKKAYRPWEIDDSSQENIKQEDLDVSEAISRNKIMEINIAPNIYEKSFKALYGLQKNIIIYLCNKISYIDEQCAYTSFLEIGDIIKFTRSTRGAVATSLTRLKQKGLILTHENKPGRGGFSCFKLNKEFYNFIKNV